MLLHLLDVISIKRTTHHHNQHSFSSSSSSQAAGIESIPAEIQRTLAKQPVSLESESSDDNNNDDNNSPKKPYYFYVYALEQTIKKSRFAECLNNQQINKSFILFAGGGDDSFYFSRSIFFGRREIKYIQSIFCGFWIFYFGS